ncbi:iron-sulfur cluster assembly scaffold protein [Pararhodobacter aggregans]
MAYILSRLGAPEVSETSDLIKLYSTRILALAAEIPHLGRLETPQASVKKRSPLCGSTVTVDLSLKDGRVADFAQEVKACALGQASAAVLGEAVIGRTPEELEAAASALESMLKQDGPVPPAPFDGYEALLPAREFKNRHASILLSVQAAAEAARQAAA